MKSSLFVLISLLSAVPASFAMQDGCDESIEKCDPGTFYKNSAHKQSRDPSINYPVKPIIQAYPVNPIIDDLSPPEWLKIPPSCGLPQILKDQLANHDPTHFVVKEGLFNPPINPPYARYTFDGSRLSMHVYGIDESVLGTAVAKETTTHELMNHLESFPLYKNIVDEFKEFSRPLPRTEEESPDQFQPLK